MIMKEFKGTKGIWKVGKRKSNGVDGFEIHWSSDGECVTDHVYNEYDAELIADAGNTIQKCGLLPSELLEQRGELLDMLNRFIENNMMSVVDNELATELINKINQQ